MAGGKSRRFGSDKARAVLDGRPLIVRVAQTLAGISDGVYVVADRAGKYDDLGLTTVADLEPSLGPLGGLITALEHRAAVGGSPWLMVCSCDLVEVSPEWFEHLWSHRREGALALVMDDGEWQPLAAMYHVGLLGHARRQVEAGRLAMWSMLHEAGEAVCVVRAAEGLRLRQANRPEDLPRGAPPGVH